MKRIAARVGTALAVVMALLVVYGVMIEPRLILDEERIEVPLPALGREWDGAEVAFFSDIQLGMWLANEGMVERIVDDVVEVNPAAVLLGGDYVYHNTPEIPEQVADVVDLLAPLIEADIPTYAVMGNHDYNAGAVEALTRAFEDLGIVVLQNEAAVIAAQSEPSGLPLYVVGVGAARPGQADVDRALTGVPEAAPRLVLMHNPTTFPEFPAGSAPFAIAGHTHCGQIALPAAPDWSYLGLTAEEALVADGFAPPRYGQPGNSMFVSCGVGFSLIPVRINAPPQVVFLNLEPG